MIEPRPAALDHVGREGLRAVDHAPQIDTKDALPIVRGPEHRTAGLDAGIVHQDIGAAEPLRDRWLRAPRPLRARLTSTAAVMMSAAPPGAADDSFAAAAFSRSSPRSAMQTFMPACAKRSAAAKPDAGCASGDHGNMIGRHHGMGHRSVSRTHMWLTGMGLIMNASTIARTMYAGAWEVFMHATRDNAGSALRFRGRAVEFGI